MKPLEVLVCGGGIAGLEGLLRLRRLAVDAVRITLLSPNQFLDYRPLAVVEAFAQPPAFHVPIEQIAADAEARWIPDTLHWVDRQSRVVHTGSGHRLAYDALLLALGGRPLRSEAHMDVFTSEHGPSMYRHIVEQIDDGSLRSVAFVVPDGPHWPLPLYELALMTSHHAQLRGKAVDIALITADPNPLNVFGRIASEAVRELLRDAGVHLYCSATAHMPKERQLYVSPRDRRAGSAELHPDRTVTVPRITGPDVQGIPGDATHRFLPLTPWCEVSGAGNRVWAAGDGTDTPIKHGAIGAQQADTAAAGIAHLAGVGPHPKPLHPVLRGRLLTGSDPLYLFAHVIAGQGWNAEVYRHSPWSLEEEVVAEDLGRYVMATSDASFE
jgi:sulfide:quinone oxidoreductase